jgi:hypothetical protein
MKPAIKIVEEKQLYSGDEYECDLTDDITVCCGCGMVHKTDFYIRGKRLFARTWRSSKLTAQLAGAKRVPVDDKEDELRKALQAAYDWMEAIQDDMPDSDRATRRKDQRLLNRIKEALK